MHTTTHHTRGVYRLGEVLSVESVLIEYTLHRANLTGRAGWYARRRRGGAPLSFQENAFDVVVDLVRSGEHPASSMRDPVDLV